MADLAGSAVKADETWGGESDVHNGLHHEDNGSVEVNDVQRDLGVHEGQELGGVDQLVADEDASGAAPAASAAAGTGGGDPSGDATDGNAAAYAAAAYAAATDVRLETDTDPDREETGREDGVGGAERDVNAIYDELDDRVSDDDEDGDGDDDVDDNGREAEYPEEDTDALRDTLHRTEDDSGRSLHLPERRGFHDAEEAGAQGEEAEYAEREEGNGGFLVPGDEEWASDHDAGGYEEAPDADHASPHDGLAMDRATGTNYHPAYGAIEGGDSGDDGLGYRRLPPAAPSKTASNNPRVPIAGRDRQAQAVIEALQEIYRTKLKPIEGLSMFHKFHYEALADSELQAKPQVLVLGPYSTGKTTLIRHLIGRDFPGMDIGPEPSTEAFQAIMAGAEERVINGAAVCIADELPYGGVGKFGAPFLSKFQVSTTPAPLLEHLTFVDTPGMLSGDSRASRRGYPFAKVVKWFADRSDLVLLLFDAHKLDLGKEFRTVIDAIAHQGDKVRVVLNKAHEVDGDRLIKVYGALMWSIGRCLRDKADVPKVYVGSFWDGARGYGEGGDDGDGDRDGSLEEETEALRREILDLPKNTGSRKINDVMQRAKLVKVHLQIMYAISSRMPRLWGREAAQERIMDSLEELFEQVRTEANVPATDMPDVEEYRRALSEVDFRELPRRNRRLLATLDAIIERDIKQCVTTAGGVRGIYKLDSAARVQDVASNPPAGARRGPGGSSMELGRLLEARNDDVRGNMRASVAYSRDRHLREYVRRNREESSDEGVSDEDEDRMGVDSGMLGGGGNGQRRKRRAESDPEVPFLLGAVAIVFFVCSLGTLILLRYQTLNVSEFLSWIKPIF